MMASNYLLCEGREIHFTEWGAHDAMPVIAWHGLARTGRDMDELAAHLSDRYRVICPDTIGRGLSQWSPQPEREYCLAFYGRLAVSLADQLGLERFHWVGTSMGGALGIRLAAGALKGRIRRLVLNDIGPKLGDFARPFHAEHGADAPRTAMHMALGHAEVGPIQAAGMDLDQHLGALR